MTKNMYLALLFLALLFAGCGFFVAVIQTDEMKKDVDMFLLRHRLQQNVVYDGAVFSPTHPAVVKNVRLKNKTVFSFPNATEKVTLSAMEGQNGVPVLLKIKAQGVTFRLTDLARSVSKTSGDFARTLNDYRPVSDILTEPLASLMLAGCDALNADVALDYAYFPAEQKAAVRLNLTDACLGNALLTVGLAGVSPETQQAAFDALKNFVAGREKPSSGTEGTNDLAVTKISLAYTEGRLIKGYKRYLDSLYLRLPGRAADVSSTNRMQAIASYLSFYSIHKQRNLDIARNLTLFVDEPKTVVFESKAKKPVPLKVLKGDLTGKTIDLLMRLDTDVILP